MILETLREHLTLDADDARALVRRVFGAHPPPNFAFGFWDGEDVAWGEEPDSRITFADAETFRRCFAAGDPAQFAEAYIDGRLLVEGDLWAATALATDLRRIRVRLRDRLRFAPKLVVPASSHTPERDRHDVQAHYDLSDDFFRLFLDDKMVYSCAYFAHPRQSLEQAQERKLELVCRKLALRPGESLLDVGCGWGALVVWAARKHGVKAHGITLSQNQAAEARRRVAAAGLTGRVSIEIRHYTDLPEDAYDKVSSVGMCEHVGLAKLPAYTGAVHRTLRCGGLFLNHGITEPPVHRRNAGGAFIYRHVFPGAELTSVAVLQSEMEAAGFEIADVQSLRPHYALTLRAWFERYRARRAEASRLVPERVLRVWDLYLAGCARAFADGHVGVHQILAAKPDDQGRTRAPFTREEMALGGDLTPP